MPIRFRINLPGPFVWVPRQRRRDDRPADVGLMLIALVIVALVVVLVVAVEVVS